MKTCIILLITNILTILLLLKIKISLVLLKINCIFLLVLLIYILRMYPVWLLKKLSYARSIRYRFPDQFILRTRKDHIKNILILSVYILFFIVFILILRLLRTSNSLNLPLLIEKVLSYILNMPIYHTLINFALILLCIITYRKLILICKGLFQREFIKRYLYYSVSDQFRSFIITIYKLTLYNLTREIKYIVSCIFYYGGYKLEEVKDEYSSPDYSISLTIVKNATKSETMIRNFIQKLIPNLHYILLCGSLLYDILFNGGILITFYKIMPYYFIYTLYISYSKFLEYGDTYKNKILSYMLYKPITIFSETDWFLGEEIYERSHCARIITKYAYHGLFDKEYYEVSLRVDYPPGRIKITLLKYYNTTKDALFNDSKYNIWTMLLAISIIMSIDYLTL